MAGFIKKAYDFLTYEMWRRTNSEMSGRKRLGDRILKTIVLVVRGFISKDLNMRANALTYSLLFAIVPILAMILAIAKGFGMADVIEQQLQNSFMGETNMVPTIMAFVDRYLETAQGGVFLGIGLLILIWAVYSFFQNVESAFNGIWNVRQSRSILRQLTTYIAILFLIPVLIIVSSGISIFLSSASEAIPMFAFLNSHEGLITRLIQWATAVGIFTWMYMAIPNTKVKLICALVPAIVFGTLYQLLQLMSVYVIMFLGRTSIVYGAFASIPILLTWLQWTCLLILIGAQMSFAMQNNEQFEYEHDLQKMSRRYKDYIMYYLLHLIICRFENDEMPQTSHEMARENHLPLRLVNQLLNRLLAVGLIREIYTEGKQEKTFLPAMDSHKITFGKVMERIDKQGVELFIEQTTPQMKAYWNQILKINEKTYKIHEETFSTNDGLDE